MGDKPLKGVTQRVHNLCRSVGLGAVCGVLAGAAAALFLISLAWATRFRGDHLSIIWGLPLVGLGIGWVFHHHGRDIAAGNNLILDEIHDPKKVVPFKMAPFIFLGTVATHLFGGSAGREGTAVQMGASLSDQLSRFLKLSPRDRKMLLMAGAGAGFGAAIGAPWAGAVFGMEVINVGTVKPVAWLECGVASFVGYYTTRFLGAPHSVYPLFPIPSLDVQTLLYVALAGAVFGITARVFVQLTHLYEMLLARLVRYHPLKPFFGGLLLVCLFYLEASYRFSGLGIPVIQDALVHQNSVRDPVMKIFFTVLTVGSGFKGGEFIPLVFIGTTLGSALGVLIPVSFQLLGGLGFAAVFAGAANTPLACALMAMEIFGFRIAPYALTACLMSFLFSGKKGIYKSQRARRAFT